MGVSRVTRYPPRNPRLRVKTFERGLTRRTQGRTMTVMSFVETLEPRAVWQHFDRILTIPRGSKEEDKIRQYVIDVADRKGLTHDVDIAGNLVVRKPGSSGHEKAPIVILQGHLDMVNEKNSDVQHDFAVDPINPRRDGDYLTATGTTLGADNGIGVAAMLALMESDSAVHGPLEFLFTIDEETGLTGAGDLDASLLAGRHLINLDSEEENTVTVGCAGGAGNKLHLALQTEDAAGEPLAVRVHGMRGGHSGLDIHLPRANAVKVLARLLYAAQLKQPLQLADFAGGNKHNAIPREAAALVYAANTAAVRSAIDTEFAGIKSEYASGEPDMQLTIETAPAGTRKWTAQTTSQVLRLLEALPHGPLAMSADIPGLVETSNNLATASAQNDKLTIGTSSRSSVMSALRAVQRRIRAIGELAGANVDEETGYPGWKPDITSNLLAQFREVHQELLGREPETVALHAGLECGIIGEKVPGMEMISFGPQIEFPHSPNERVQIHSVERFFDLLTTFLHRLAARTRE